MERRAARVKKSNTTRGVSSNNKDWQAAFFVAAPVHASLVHDYLRNEPGSNSKDDDDEDKDDDKRRDKALSRRISFCQGRHTAAAAAAAAKKDDILSMLYVGG